MQKIFNPVLVARTLISPYIPSLAREEARNAPSWWESKSEGEKYARVLAEGLTFWSTIDIIGALTLVFVSLFVSIPPVALLFFACLMIGGPIFMTLGIGFGCLQHLSVREVWTIVHDYFLERN